MRKQYLKYALIWSFFLEKLPQLCVGLKWGRLLLVFVVRSTQGHPYWKSLSA